MKSGDPSNRNDSNKGAVPPSLPLSIIIVNWNVRELLHRCLTSLATCDLQLATEVIVVDNASSDGSTEIVRREFPAVHVTANDTNLGFTVANNQGIRHSRGRYALLLNPDTVVVGDALTAMVAYLDTHPKVAALGPKLLNPDGSVQSSRRRFPTLATGLLESTVLQRWFPRSGVLSRYYVLDHSDDDTQEVDWVVGAAMAMRREAIDQVGLLDEEFFMYSEELDWCYRAKAAGWKVVYLPTAQIVHYGAQSSEQVKAAQHVHFQTSKVRFFRKHRGHTRAELLRWFILATYAFQLAEEGAKWLVGHKRPLRASRVRAYWQVLRSGLR
jgi:GT2 family glycosyltransferase